MQPQFANQQPQLQQPVQQFPDYTTEQFGGPPMSQSAQPLASQQYANQPAQQPRQVGAQQPQQRLYPQQPIQGQQPGQPGLFGISSQPGQQRIQSQPQSSMDPFGGAQSIGTQIPAEQQSAVSIPVQQQPAAPTQGGQPLTTVMPQPTSPTASQQPQQPQQPGVPGQGQSTGQPFAQPAASQGQIPWQQRSQLPAGPQVGPSPYQQPPQLQSPGLGPAGFGQESQYVQAPQQGQQGGAVPGGQQMAASSMPQQGEFAQPQGMQAAAESMKVLRGTPSVDILETPDEIQVYADVPGFDPESVEVLCDDSMLTVLARRDVAEEEDATWIQRERPTEIQRELRLPAHAIVDEAEATCENGVCTITLPKSEEGRQKRIGIQ